MLELSKLIGVPGTRPPADRARLQGSSGNFPISLTVNNFCSTLITVFIFFPLFGSSIRRLALFCQAVLGRINDMFCL